MNNLFNPVTTLRIVENPSRPGEISAMDAGRDLAAVWGGVPGGRAEGIWNVSSNSDPTDGRPKFEVGEHITCEHPDCNPLRTYDERRLSLQDVPLWARNLPNASAQFQAIIDERGMQFARRICNDPKNHTPFIEFFWSARRAQNYVLNAVRSPNNISMISYSTLGPNLQRYTVGWALACNVEIDKWLKVAADPDRELLRIVMNSPTGQMFDVDTIGRDKRIDRRTARLFGGKGRTLFGNFFHSYIYPHALTDVLEVYMRMYQECEENGTPIVFRSSLEEGPHIIEFAKLFFESIQFLARSSVRPDREYFLARGPRIAPEVLQRLKPLKGVHARLKRLDQALKGDRGYNELAYQN